MKHVDQRFEEISTQKKSSPWFSTQYILNLFCIKYVNLRATYWKVSNTLLSFSIGLWNCQSDFITSITSHSRLNLMALTETWIKPEDNATPAALSNNFSFSHTPRLTGRGGGTGLLISNNWKFAPLPSLSINSSFESHSVTITYPLKIHFVVVYRPPGPLGNFVEELDVLLSTFPEDGTPLVILGDFNIHLDKPRLQTSTLYLPLLISREC